MRHTLTAVFDDRGAAQHALNKLLAAGFTQEDAALSPAAPARQAGKGAAPGGKARAYLLTLMTESQMETDRAIGLVGRLVLSDEPPADAITARRYGNEMHLSEKYRNRSWDEVGRELKSGWERGDSRVPDWNASEAAIRRGWDEASPEIDEDSYYRTHWNAQYAHEAGGDHTHGRASGSADEARDGFQYRMRRWTAVAADRKAGWTSRHLGELPPWERFKDALLHGWGRINLGNDNQEDGRPPR
jgi:hypothetical protein